ncbi:MAG TPA: hypothetical protein VF245_03325 [Solirubrobacterales bacterium]
MAKIATLTLAIALAMPVPAGAAVHAIVPPGNSESDQYSQTIPGSTGPRVPDPTKDPGDAVRAGALSEAAARALRQGGANGAALATAVAQTTERGAGSPAAPGAPGRPSGDSGLGDGFQLLLLAIAAAALVYAIARRRGLATR